MKHSILRLKEKAFDLQCKFIARFKQTWGLRESVEELNVQTGHLCQSFVNNKRFRSNVNAFNQPHRTLTNIKDELCDCFLSICSIYKFYGIKEDELPTHNIPQKEPDELVMELFILSTQLLDSTLILQGIKPPLNRDENLIFLNNYSAILKILEQISIAEKLDIETEFDKMIEQTLSYLKG